MKLPNGFGSVYKLSGKRRNPWIVRKTTGWRLDEDAGKNRQQYVTVGYYPTRQEALSALALFNENPYDIKRDSITFSEVYEKWSDTHFRSIVPSAVRTWKSAYSHSRPLHNMRMRDIRASHLEGAIRDADVGQTTKQRMKSLYNQLYRYSMKNEIVDRDYAALCDSVKRGKPKIVHIPFTDSELSLLWDSLDFPFVDMVLVGIYSGFRPQELSILRVADTDLDRNTFFGGIKTEAGRNRYVPIHPKILPLVERNLRKAAELGSEYLFNDEWGQQGTYMTYDKYRGRFNKIARRLKLEHRPHDTRHTFITLGKRYCMDEYILKLIVGHQIRDITEKVYTHRTMEQLQEEIRKIP